MSPTDRCDEVIRLIDGVLAGAVADETATPDTPTDAAEDAEAGRDDVAPPTDDDSEVEVVPGHWGVYYFRPSG